MAHLSTSLEVINRWLARSLEIADGLQVVCTTLVFIREVTQDSKHAAHCAVQLQEILIFLEAYSEVCFSDVTGLLRDTQVHPTLTRDVEDSLFGLNKTLAAHREAWRYVPVSSDSEKRDIEEMSSPTIEVQYERKRWRDDMKERSQIWRERARPGLYGVLFGREEMENLVSSCQRHISKMRQTLEIILLTSGPPIPEFWRSEEAAILGIEEVLERQHRVNLQPSAGYNALPGSLRDNGGDKSSTFVKTVYKDGNDEVDVIVESRPDSETPTEFLCHLTWLLQNLTQDNPLAQAGDYRLQTLKCIGFCDDPINNRGLILYRSPQGHPWASHPPSLHSLIASGSVAKKLTLSNRFRTAKTLASSVLATHASGWVHRSICSRNIIMSPRKLEAELSPYLLGWGVPNDQDTNTFSLESNIYQHRDRFGKPRAEFQPDHDVYALGVVLLEIGLWKTISAIFARRLQKAPRFAVAEQDKIFQRTNNALIEFADSNELKREMGDRYAEVVLTCLTWSPENPVVGMLEFRSRVVDVLSSGCPLW